MAVPARRSSMTAEELFELPDDGGRSELVAGEVIHLAPTGAEHGVVTARIGHLIQDYAIAHGTGVCCGAETGFILQRGPDVVRAPDVAFVTEERIPETGIPQTYWPFAPDLAVEVVSPSERLTDCIPGRRTSMSLDFALWDECIAGLEPKGLVDIDRRIPHFRSRSGRRGESTPLHGRKDVPLSYKL